MPVSDIIRLQPEDVQAVMGCDWDTAVKWADPLSGAAVLHHINTSKRMAPWLATIAHESSGLTRLEENLNYSVKRLEEIWPSRFGPGKANPFEYANNPEKLANKVYGGRMGNTEEGDGWKYRGRGPIQLTGKFNYQRCMDSIRTDIVRFPDLLKEPSVGALSAGWFWESNGLNELADNDQFEDIVRKVNGGLIGWEDRVEKLQLAQKVMEDIA